ncbi:MAG: hypothetical protein RL607_1172 [Bacteroidota bacterium]
MKTKLLFSILLSGLYSITWAQDRTTVSATNSEISDNLDLRAVASIFGDSRDLEDFERRLNDPKTPISNLDLNNDNQVDYLRVVESVEGNQHIIVLQAVLAKDQYQDVATVEVETNPRTKQVQVQVVGDVYMYGANYIYEPVYVSTPVIYNYFWTPYYRPYCSSWYWGYYPSYYYAWNPFPIFRYRHHIGLCINFNYYYNYVNFRRCHVAYNHYYSRRCNYYESRYPNRSFAYRNHGVANRYELDRTRPTRNVAYPDTRDALAGTRDVNNPRGNSNVRGNDPVRSTQEGNVRSNWTSTANPRPVRQDYSTTNNVNTPRPTRSDYSVTTETPRPVRQDYSTTNSMNSPRPTRSDYSVNTESPRPVRQDYSTTNNVNTPRPTRSDYSVTTESPRPVRQDYSSSNSVTPRPSRQDYTAPSPRVETPSYGGGRQNYSSPSYSSGSSGGGRSMNAASSGGGRSSGGGGRR